MLDRCAPQKPPRGTRKRLKARGKRQEAKANGSVYQAVDLRDCYRCRACGDYAGVDVHRHHLRGRKFTTLEDVCHVCQSCHRLMHVRLGGKKLKLYGNADTRNQRGVLNGLTAEWWRPGDVWIVEAGR